MNKVLFRIHWLSFTVHAEKHKGYGLYSHLFKSHFGPIESLGHGGRGFREISKAALGTTLYASPVKSDEEYFHFELPGVACEALLPEDFLRLHEYLGGEFKEHFAYKRLDLAFDKVLFEPKQIEEALLLGQVRTLAKRETIRIFSSPFEARENGEIGTSNCTNWGKFLRTNANYLQQAGICSVGIPNSRQTGGFNLRSNVLCQ